MYFLPTHPRKVRAVGCLYRDPWSAHAEIRLSHRLEVLLQPEYMHQLPGQLFIQQHLRTEADPGLAPQATRLRTFCSALLPALNFALTPTNIPMDET